MAQLLLTARALLLYSYFHGLISRAEAEARLINRDADGTFLVRIGRNGKEVISVRHACQCQHFEIHQAASGGVTLGGPVFSNISQMVASPSYVISEEPIFSLINIFRFALLICCSFTYLMQFLRDLDG